MVFRLEHGRTGSEFGHAVSLNETNGGHQFHACSIKLVGMGEAPYTIVVRLERSWIAGLNSLSSIPNMVGTSSVIVTRY